MKKHSLKAIMAACLAACTAMAFTACAGDKGTGDGGSETPPTDEYGSVSIEDIQLYINSNKNATFAEIKPVFTNPDKAEELTYTSSNNKILDITDGIVKPKVRDDKTVTVTAKSEHFETTFKVDVEYIDYNSSDASALYDMTADMSDKVTQRANTCKAVNGNTTLFVGDSFMDSYFIGEYMTTYAEGKEVLNAGISSTTSYHWEKTYEQIIGKTAPKNIVIHVGTNNFYDEYDTVEDTETSLMRLFMFMHDSYPTSNIYWFNITQRSDTAYADRVNATNSYIKDRSEELDFLTVVDTSSKVTTAMLRDGVHPTTDNYHVFTDELVKAGCEIVNKA